jgi:hypothetical protein
MAETGIRQRVAQTAKRMRSFNLLRFLIILGIIAVVLAVLFIAGWHWAWRYATNSPRHDELAVEASKPLLTFNTSTPSSAAAAAPAENPLGVPEAPIANYAEYRRCGGAAQTVRAHGELISCSVPNITDRFAAILREGETFYRQMRGVCNRHDFCYAQGGATYGLDRTYCDKTFLADLVRECALIYGDPAEPRRGGSESSSGNTARQTRARTLMNAQANCRRQASVAYAALRLQGRDYYRNNYQPVCDYEPGAHAARDAVVTGRFLDAADSAGAKDYGLTVSLARDARQITLRLLELNTQGQSEERGTWSLTPEMVPVTDRDRTCRALSDAADSPIGARCPQTLKDTAITAADWTRFQPIVIDADGRDGAEVLLLSLTRDFGLGLTHIRFTRGANGIAPEFRGYLGAARFSEEAGGKDCEWNLEFSDCETALRARREQGEMPILSGERSIQSLFQSFLVVNRRQRGCGDAAFLGQDLVLNSGHALRDTSKDGNMGFRFRRFTYDAAGDRWLMHRDRHQNDGHRAYRCGGVASPFEHYKRFQYPQFNAGFDAECDSQASCPNKCSDPARGQDRLEMVGAVMREKCPTSTFRPGAGELNDIDLMLYDANTNITAQTSQNADRRDNSFDWVNAIWSPLVWKEPAHPLVTSPEARRGPDRIMAVGTYVGGDGTQKILEEIRTGLTYADEPENADQRRLANFRRMQQRRNRWQDRRYPVITVLRHQLLFHRTLLGHTVGERGGGEVRIPDTHGHLPDRYAVSWDIEAYGNPASYYELPSVLLSLGTEARAATQTAPLNPVQAQEPAQPQMGMAFFLNPYLSANLRTERQRGPGDEAEVAEWQSGDFRLADGMFRALIIPVPQPGDAPADVARMIDCPISGAAAGGAPARSAQGWTKHFLKNEPVLVGRFYSMSGPDARQESMAVSWRREDGAIQLTALRFDGGSWRFGNAVCQDPVAFSGQARERPELKLRKLP